MKLTFVLRNKKNASQSTVQSTLQSTKSPKQPIIYHLPPIYHHPENLHKHLAFGALVVEW
ncbi:MAG: hypothetical protein K6F47_00885 [Bacteroidaceae bacterium]|nr:hypothetical protein [Bacteroidaceae bacterium]